MTAVTSLKVNIPVQIDGHTVEIRQENGVFMGMVDHSNFGQGKTRRAAENGINRRLVFLAGNPGHIPQLSGADLEASMAAKELDRRVRSEKWKRLLK